MQQQSKGHKTRRQLFCPNYLERERVDLDSFHDHDVLQGTRQCASMGEQGTLHCLVLYLYHFSTRLLEIFPLYMRKNCLVHGEYSSKSARMDCFHSFTQLRFNHFNNRFRSLTKPRISVHGTCQYLAQSLPLLIILRIFWPCWKQIPTQLGI
jgi:hypothetical protein